MMKKVFLYSLVLLLFGGCSLQTRIPAKTQYKLQMPSQTQEYNATACKDDVLGLRNVVSYDPIMDRSIYYQVGELNIATYSESNWEAAPFKTVGLSLISSIRESKIFKDAFLSSSFVKPDIILEYNVGEFIQHFSEDMKSSYVTVNIHFALLERKDSKLLYSTTIEKKVPVSSLDALGGVKALQSALNDVLMQTNLWLNTKCQKELK
jgi:ABC-type uncharacterized transport system auxiliary subunit